MNAERANFDVTVVFNSGQFLPLFLVTVGDRSLNLSIHARLNSTAPFADGGRKEDDEEDESKSVRFSKTKTKRVKKPRRIPPSRPGLVIRRLPGLDATWCPSLSRSRLQNIIHRNVLFNRICAYGESGAVKVGEELEDAYKDTLHGEASTETQGVNVVYAIDKSQSMGSGFRRLALPACSELHKQLQPEWGRCVLFGETIESLSIKNFDFFKKSGQAAKTRLEPATALVKGVEKAVELLLKR